MPFTDDQFEDLPDALVSDLRATYGRTSTTVPPTVDAAILHEARAAFARRRRFQLALRGFGAVAAAAAIIALALPLIRSANTTKRVAKAPVQTQLISVVPANEDVDGSGKVDILDAFVVAKLIETKNQIDETYDVNHDGKVDQADVDRIAVAAVNTSDVDAGGRRVQ